jgi:hypothetical protein
MEHFMNKKTKKIASLVLGLTLVGTTMTSCMGSKSSCAGMGDKSNPSEKAKAKGSCSANGSCGANGCGSN